MQNGGNNNDKRSCCLHLLNMTLKLLLPERDDAQIAIVRICRTIKAVDWGKWMRMMCNKGKMRERDGGCSSSCSPASAKRFLCMLNVARRLLLLQSIVVVVAAAAVATAVDKQCATTSLQRSFSPGVSPSPPSTTSCSTFACDTSTATQGQRQPVMAPDLQTDIKLAWDHRKTEKLNNWKKNPLWKATHHITHTSRCRKLHPTWLRSSTACLDKCRSRQGVGGDKGCWQL